jgi:type IV pilus assembly protein PilN
MSTRLNLLPWREIRRKEQDRQLLTMAFGAWILMGLVVFYAHLHVTGLIDNQNQRNEFLQQQIAKLDKEIKAIRELKKQRTALIARMNVIYELQGDRTQVVHVFDDLVRKLPEGIYFTSVKQKGKSIAIKGVAQSNARVSALMRNLESSDWFADPNLDVINVRVQGSDRVSTFSLRVKESARVQKQTAPAKSAKRRQAKK